jgi:hypothetical protein
MNILEVNDRLKREFGVDYEMRTRPNNNNNNGNGADVLVTVGGQYNSSFLLTHHDTEQDQITKLNHCIEYLKHLKAKYSKEK